MSPAFSSRRSAIAFALLVGALLALPALVSHTHWLDRRQVYPTIGWRFGSFPWIQKKIFSETSDVDIAFLGSSMIWTDVSSVYVQRKLSEQLNRRAEVFTLGWNDPGFDALYLVARDLLEHRRCRTLVIYDEHGGTDLPQWMVFKAYRVGEFSDALVGLAWSDRMTLYAGAVLGLPRHLLSLMRSDRIEAPGAWQTNPLFALYGADDLVAQNGALRVHREIEARAEFQSFKPAAAATPADVLTYSATMRPAFTLGERRTPAYQLHFARELAKLCAEHHTQLVIFHLPEFSTRSHKTIQSPSLWSEVLGAPVEFVGIPEAKLFAGLSLDDVKKLFYNNIHMNLNGQDFFTPLITPALIKLYVEANRH